MMIPRLGRQPGFLPDPGRTGGGRARGRLAVVRFTEPDHTIKGDRCDSSRRRRSRRTEHATAISGDDLHPRTTVRGGRTQPGTGPSARDSPLGHGPAREGQLTRERARTRRTTHSGTGPHARDSPGWRTPDGGAHTPTAHTPHRPRPRHGESVDPVKCAKTSGRGRAESVAYVEQRQGPTVEVRDVRGGAVGQHRHAGGTAPG